jgi:hypothetical protein
LKNLLRDDISVYFTLWFVIYAYISFYFFRRWCTYSLKLHWGLEFSIILTLLIST